MSDTNIKITPQFRGSFVTFAEPRAVTENADPKFSIGVVLNKNNPTHMAYKKKMEKAIKEMVVSKWGEKSADRIIRAMKHYPLKDGDNQTTEHEVEEYHGSWFFSASSKQRPGVLRGDKSVIQHEEMEEECYSGAWYRISLNLFAWEHKTGGKGVSVGLLNAQKTKNDDAFTGRTKAEDDFDVVDDDEEEDYDEGEDLLG